MATFAGKQPGYANPTMRHESALKALATTPTFAGAQPKGAAAPAVHALPRRAKDRTPVKTWYDELPEDLTGRTDT